MKFRLINSHSYFIAELQPNISSEYPLNFLILNHFKLMNILIVTVFRVHLLDSRQKYERAKFLSDGHFLLLPRWAADY